jgi:L-amino acid N-acyltransferase YncA
VTPEYTQAHSDEYGSIINTWRASYRKGSVGAQKRVADGTYDEWMRRRASRLIAQSVVVCARDPEDPSVIWGWAVGERGDNRDLIVHYVYVKAGFRQFGIGFSLLVELQRACGLDGDVSNRYYTHRRAPYTIRAEKQGWQFAPKLGAA